jgi:hypothetical protein
MYAARGKYNVQMYRQQASGQNDQKLVEEEKEL